MSESATPPRLSEILLLASLWMLFGFMLWYYLAVFHGIPVRIVSEAILHPLLGADFVAIVPHPDKRYLFQVQTAIPFTFPDGSRASLGFIVNPLVFGYGLPLLFGLVMGTEEGALRKAAILLGGYVIVAVVQVWGTVWETLKMLAFDFGSVAGVVVQEAGVPENLIALCYQLGVLILPPLAPVMLWVLTHWPLVERLTGWADRPRP